ncbi:MAG: threonine/serine dehydratase [bacterium]|nr:threonine/serine dehydratase [bacterium]
MSLQNVYEAKKAIAHVAHKTPLVHSKTLSKIAGNEIYLKCENLQKTGSFKIRGAYNAVSKLSCEEKQRGVVTGSSGNHGQALAYAASLQGVRSVIVMPEDASRAKIAACQGYGGEVILCGLTSEDRLHKALELVRCEGLTMVHPYDNYDVIAGQGTIGIEIMEDLPDVDVVVAQIGGGGLISGISIAVKALQPKVIVVGVEPAVGARMRYSWERGEPSELLEWKPSIADGVRTKKPGKLTYAITRELVDLLVTVEEEQIVNATKLILERTKMLSETSGAVAVAATLAESFMFKNKKVVCIISGGNIELSALAALLS